MPRMATVKISMLDLEPVMDLARKLQEIAAVSSDPKTAASIRAAIEEMIYDVPKADRFRCEGCGVVTVNVANADAHKHFHGLVINIGPED